MKTKNGENSQSHGRKWALASAFIAAVCFLCATRASAQSIPQPVLSYSLVISNQMIITITNGVNYAAYDLYTTPILANSDYPWTAAAVGAIGQTNFTVNIGVLPSSFYMVFVDTNVVPIWAAANPNNPSAGYLQVFIYGPANGATLQ